MVTGEVLPACGSAAPIRSAGRRPRSRSSRAGPSPEIAVRAGKAADRIPAHTWSAEHWRIYFAALREYNRLGARHGRCGSRSSSVARYRLRGARQGSFMLVPVPTDYARSAVTQPGAAQIRERGAGPPPARDIGLAAIAGLPYLSGGRRALLPPIYSTSVTRRWRPGSRSIC